MKSAPNRSQRGSQNREKVIKTRSDNLCEKRAACPEGRRRVAGALLRLIISSRLVFRLVLASFHVSGPLVTSRKVVSPARYPFSSQFLVFGCVLTSCSSVSCTFRLAASCSCVIFVCQDRTKTETTTSTHC